MKKDHCEKNSDEGNFTNPHAAQEEELEEEEEDILSKTKQQKRNNKVGGDLMKNRKNNNHHRYWWLFGIGILGTFFVVVLLVLFLSSKKLNNAGGNLNGEKNTDFNGGLCATPFGTIIGISHNTPAFSNCNSSYCSNEGNWETFKTDAPPEYTGMKWQCVEYGRRFLMTKYGVAYGDVVGAADIWPLTTVFSIENKQKLFPFKSFPNGAEYTVPLDTSVVPKPGDVLIYPIQGTGSEMPFGHITAVVKVDAHFVYIGEENWNSKMWSGFAQNYSRALRWEIVKNENGSKVRVQVHDTDGYKIDGWKRVQL